MLIQKKEMMHALVLDGNDTNVDECIRTRILLNDFRNRLITMFLVIRIMRACDFEADDHYEYETHDELCI